MSTAAAAELVIEGELQDPGPVVPAPGDQWTIALMLYTVLRVVEGDYRHPDILVGHPDADPARPEFRPGARHLLQLTHEFPAEASLVSSREPGGRGSWYCIAFEPL